MGNTSGKSKVSDHVALEPPSDMPPLPSIIVEAATPISSPNVPLPATFPGGTGTYYSSPDDPVPPPLPRTPPPPLSSANVEKNRKKANERVLERTQPRERGSNASMASIGMAATRALKEVKRRESHAHQRRISQPRLFNAPPIPALEPTDFLQKIATKIPHPPPPSPTVPVIKSPFTPSPPPSYSSTSYKPKETPILGVPPSLPSSLPPPIPQSSPPVLNIPPPPQSMLPPLEESSSLSTSTAPQPTPRQRKNIIYAKDRIAQFEALNTTVRSEKSVAPPPSVRSEKVYASPAGTAAKYKEPDNYPLYNPVEDFSFDAGKTFQKGAYPIDANRTNIAFVGRPGVGKSTLINALRGISNGDANAAGKIGGSEMEPFRFTEDTLQHLVLWELEYPRTFATVSDIYDRNMSFNRFYDSRKLNVFAHVFILISDGAPSDDDIAFARVVKSRRTPITIVLSKSDIDIDAEARELSSQVNSTLLTTFQNNAHRVFTRILEQKAPVLLSVPVFIVSSPTVRNLVSSTRGYLHYKLDEENMLSTLKLEVGCHAALEAEQRRQLMTMGYASREQISLPGYSSMSTGRAMTDSRPTTIHKATVLADAGFEIVYGTDDRVFGNMEPKTSVRRAGRTCFNYAFVGGSGVGKSWLINAMRGMTSKHPLAAGKGRAKPASVEKFEFDDDILKYSVTLWELHYPRRVNNFFEFIDANNISSFTAVFIIVKDGLPSDEDLTFAKIAHRRSASVILLSSRTDLRLKARSRSDEIPVCDMLKQSFIQKGVERFDRRMQSAAPELSGRVHLFFVSAPVFLSLRAGRDSDLFLAHERAVFDFLKQKRIIADMLDIPQSELQEGLYANVNFDTAGVYPEDPTNGEVLVR